MGFLLLLGTITIIAIASIIPILKSSLRWEATLGLGIFSSSTAGIALLLDYRNPLTIFEWATEQTVTGLPLYLPGPSDSILGKGYGFFVIAFCWGIAIIVAGLVKKKQKDSREKSAGNLIESHENKPSERNRILDELNNEIEDLRNNFDNPKHAGKADATKAGGPFPKQADQAPIQGGYESTIRRGFETLGTTFAETTVANLKTNILNALFKLVDIKNGVAQQTYKEIARAEYNLNNTAITPNAIVKNQKEYTTATQNRNAFIDSLKLRTAEQENWADDDITTHKTLIVWGIVFALIEFSVSWFFLEGEMGEAALTGASIAVVIIFIVAFFAGFLFQFMRRNQPLRIRVPAVIGYLGVGFLTFLGLGLLLNYRGVISIADIMDGYISLLSDLTNLGVFLINLFALALFYWKVLHFFDKFHGYRQVDKPYRRAEKQWGDMFVEAQEKISKALDYADEEANDNSTKATEYFADIQNKTTTLNRIKNTISTLYASTLRPSYNEDVIAYRNSNCQNRVLQANPAPDYFNAGYPFCNVEEHFREVEDIKAFFAENQEKLDQVQGNNNSITAEHTQWKTDRSTLNIELISELNTMIHNARDGAPPTDDGAVIKPDQ